jgi:hypothetical protein
MHPESAEDYFGIARVMGGIFYLERYLKLKNTALESLPLERVTALLSLVI